MIIIITDYTATVSNPYYTSNIEPKVLLENRTRVSYCETDAQLELAMKVHSNLTNPKTQIFDATEVVVRIKHFTKIEKIKVI